MAIVQKQNPPTAGRNIIGKALRDLWGRPDRRGALGGAVVSLSEPLPLYSLRLDDIDKPESISRAKPIGWRYLVENPQGVAYADLVAGPDGGEAFASLSRNQNAERLSQAAHLAESVAIGLSDCEARILDIPALNISAVWLAGAQWKFIPYIDLEKLGKPDAKISVDDNFLNRVAERAEQLRRHLSNIRDQRKGVDH
jgi:hypothetical protein